MAIPTVRLIHGADVMYVRYTPGSNVPAGAVVIQVDLLGIATQAIPVNVLGDLAVRGGVWSCPKHVGTAITAGTRLWWDHHNQRVTPTAGSLKFFGFAERVAVAGATRVEVVKELDRRSRGAEASLSPSPSYSPSPSPSPSPSASPSASPE